MPLLSALIVAVLVWSTVSDLVVTPLFGDLGYLGTNLCATLVLLAVARHVAFGPSELGLAADRVAAGLRWGAAAAGVVVGVLALGVLAGDRLGPVAALLQDERASLSAGAVAFAVLVRIPLGTVLFEEVAFRGVLDAAARRRFRPVPAGAISASVFGLYHLPPTLVALRLNAVPVTSAAGLGALAGAVALTAVAGVLFSWLRWRAGSLVAPALAHLATNVGGLLAAVATQRGLVG